MLAYLWPIMMAGWLIGRMAIPVLTSASGIAYAILVILRQRESFPVERLATPDGTSLALILSLPYLAFIALLVWLLTSEMERSEEHLRQRNTALQSLNTRLRALVSASEELLGCLDMQQLLSSALAQVERVTGHTQSAIQVLQNGAPVMQRERDLPLEALPPEDSAAIPAASGAISAVTLSRVPLSAAEGARLARAGAPAPRALTHVALRSPHGLEGRLTIASSAELPPETDEAQPLLILGHQLSIALENARNFDDLQHDRNLLRGILGRMGEGVFVVDFQGRVLLANRAAWQLLHVAEGQPLPEEFATQMASHAAAEQPQRPIPLEVGRAHDQCQRGRVARHRRGASQHHLCRPRRDPGGPGGADEVRLCELLALISFKHTNKNITRRKMSPTSMALLLRKKPWWRVPIWFSGGEHISRPGCMGEQQAKLATSLVETQQR